jgi:hypothetical protein
MLVLYSGLVSQLKPSSALVWMGAAYVVLMSLTLGALVYGQLHRDTRGRDSAHSQNVNLQQRTINTF